MIIAVDGPAASGKGTIARRIARELDFAYLDTGLLYRGVGVAVLDRGENPEDAGAATRAAESFDPALMADPRLRGDDAAVAASKVAAIPGVRAAMLDFQRGFGRTPPDGKKGAVLDGRDIGTVVFPAAQVKLFVTASVEERARRRFLELRGRGVAADPAQVAAEIRDRDAQDANRPVAPLRPAEDAVTLDTTALDAEAAFAAAMAVVRDRLAAHG